MLFRIRMLAYLLCGGVALLPPSAVAAADGYAAGVEAARDGRYEAALEIFLTVREAGRNTPALTYNLAVVNFRLGRLEQSRVEFRRLLTNDRWRALAHYNLGLIDERDGRPEAAQEHFQQAYAQAGSPETRGLAARKLAPSTPPPESPPPRWHGLVSVGAGFDDNVILADDRVFADVTDREAYFVEGLAAARRALGRNGDAGPAVDVGGYYRAHGDLGDYDFGAVSTGLTWRFPKDSWDISTGIRAAAQFSGGSSYANVITHRIQARRPSGPVVWRLRNDLSHYFGASRFDFISGWRNRSDLQVWSSTSWGSVHVGYELEFNDRDDLQRNDEFFSFSPTRHGVSSGVSVDVLPRLRIDLRGSLRWSHFAKDNRYLDEAGALVSAPRDQDLLFAEIRADYRLSGVWTVWGSVQHSSSDSAVPRYDYRADSVVVGLEAAF